jgi:predicted Zn-dependent protease
VLIAFRWDRLGARLTSIVNALRLAEAVGGEVRVLWPEAGGVSAALNDPAELFAPEFIGRHFGDPQALAARRRAAEPLARALGRPGALARLLAEGRDVVVEMVSGVALLPGEEAAEVTARCGAIFRALPWAEALRGPMVRLGAGLAGATACHIRRGDTIAAGPAMHKPWPGKFLPEEFFRPHIAAALAEGRPVVVFSDDAGLAARLAAEFPGLRTAAELLPDAGLTPAQRDLLELYAMSLCARIVAPSGSAFSATAAVLGGRARLDAKAALPAEPRMQAQQALLARLRARPDSFAGPGEIAQSVPHVTGWLVSAGRGAEAARLCADLARGGLGIGFVLAEAMELSLAHDRPEAVLALAGLLAADPPGNPRQFLRARLAEAAAHAALGADRAARRVLLNAFAGFPAEARLRAVLPGLALGGALPGAEFLPTTPALFALDARRRPLPAAGTPEAGLLRLLPGAPPVDLPRGGPEPFWLDWEPFLAPRLVAELATRAQGRRFAALLAEAGTAPDAAPEVQAAAALLDVLGDPDGPQGTAALARLRRIAAAAPGNALVQHRLSRACLAAGATPEAAAAAEAALRADAAPLHAAWAGLLLARRGRRRDEGAALLRAAVAADTGLPALALELAGVEERRGDAVAALAALDRAAAMAPRNFRLQLLRARLLRAVGDPAGARAALEALQAEGRLSPPGWRLLAEIEADAGRPAAARAALAAGLAVRPDDAGLQALAARLG